MSDVPETRAAILAVGSEMLGPLRQDTNSLWLTARLEEIGIRVVRKSIIGDDPAVIVRELETASSEASLLISTGGLGPTADDVTAAAVARWLGAPLIRNAEFVARMRARFEARGVRMAAVNEKQADFIEGARVLENPRGTAPGFWAKKGECEIVVLPGVPSEMREIMEQSVLPELVRRSGGVVSRRRILRIAGMGESAVEELVEPVYARWKQHPVTILASPGEVQLHLYVRGEPDFAETTVRAMEEDFRSVLKERIFGGDGEDLPSAVGRLLRDAGKTLALAESCTGGMAASLITDVPGSSDYFLGGVVSYGNGAKESLLGVAPETLSSRGAVSEESVLEMARGARERFDSDVAGAITGIAGPGGGTPEKPVGLVWFGIADRDGAATAKRRYFVGDRTHVRRSASVHALELIRRHLVGWKSPDA
ncbi:MAG: competence/damage-inducible protein A [Acidobacteria bacterium]|nr:competence/damage-inducible protein A [Acidobacteriota bacterium]MCA1609489.1 competence/damage-inducible protein A [Acidobacteriota bacterium]